MLREFENVVVGKSCNIKFGCTTVEWYNVCFNKLVELGMVYISDKTNVEELASIIGYTVDSIDNRNVFYIMLVLREAVSYLARRGYIVITACYSLDDIVDFLVTCEGD